MDLEKDLCVVSFDDPGAKSVLLDVWSADLGAREAGTIEWNGLGFGIAYSASSFKALDGESAFYRLDPLLSRLACFQHIILFSRILWA